MIQKTNDTTAINIVGLSALDDNYVWIITQGKTTVVIDPSEAQPVIDWLQTHQRTLSAILITHGHHDHVGGVQGLLSDQPECLVYANHQVTLPFSFYPLKINDELVVDNLAFQIVDLSGHTPDQVGFYLPIDNALFCGDALFAGGCGRLFNGGTASQMQASLSRIASLPKNTLIYCAHEYTLANLRFAQIAEPNNQATRERLTKVQGLRKQERSTLPTVLADELTTNPFLRTETPALHQAIDQHAGFETNHPIERFSQLRAWKDQLDATGILEVAP